MTAPMFGVTIVADCNGVFSEAREDGHVPDRLRELSGLRGECRRTADRLRCHGCVMEAPTTWSRSRLVIFSADTSRTPRSSSMTAKARPSGWLWVGIGRALLLWLPEGRLSLVAAAAARVPVIAGTAGGYW